MKKTPKAAAQPTKASAPPPPPPLTKTRKPINKKPLFILALIPALVPLVIYFGIVNQYSLNLPYMDDWDAILKFLSDFSLADTLGKLALLFSQHNEHRILSSRLIYIAYNAIFSGINFRSIIFIGNFQLVVILSILIYFLRKYIVGYWGIPALVVSLCLFDLNNYENGDFAMAGIQNFGVIMLFMLGLFFYGLTKKWAIFIAVSFQFICTYSSGNGILASAALVIFTIFSKDKLKIIVSTVSCIVFSGFYFFHYKSPENHFMGKTFVDMLTFFLDFSGGHFGKANRLYVAIALYLSIPFLLIVNKRINIKKEAIPFVCILLFIMASVGTTSIFRSGGKDGVDHDSYASRYLIYPHLLAATVFCLLAFRMINKKLQWPLVGFCAILFIKAYKENYTYGENGFSNENTRLTTKRYNYPDTLAAKRIEEEACKKGIYCIKDNR